MSLVTSNCDGTKNIPGPCFTDREITSTLENIDLKCLEVGEQYVSVNEKNQARYSVCNSAQHLMRKGLKYTVSGVSYEIKPNERWPGTPFQITKLTPTD